MPAAPPQPQEAPPPAPDRPRLRELGLFLRQRPPASIIDWGNNLSPEKRAEYKDRMIIDATKDHSLRYVPDLGDAIPVEGKLMRSRLFAHAHMHVGEGAFHTSLSEIEGYFVTPEEDHRRKARRRALSNAEDEIKVDKGEPSGAASESSSDESELDGKKPKRRRSDSMGTNKTEEDEDDDEEEEIEDDDDDEGDYAFGNDDWESADSGDGDD